MLKTMLLIWWVGGPEADHGLRGGTLDLGKCMKDERGSASEGVIGEVLCWGKHIEWKVLWNESDNELP